MPRECVSPYTRERVVAPVVSELPTVPELPTGDGAAHGTGWRRQGRFFHRGRRDSRNRVFIWFRWNSPVTVVQE